MRMVKSAYDHLPSELVKMLRRGDDESITAFLASDAVTGLCAKVIEDSGVPRDIALTLAIEPSVTCYQFLCILALTLRWLADGGIEAARAERVHNDILDMHYITISLFCHTLISKDQNMLRTYSILKNAVECRWRVAREGLRLRGLL